MQGYYVPIDSLCRAPYDQSLLDRYNIHSGGYDVRENVLLWTEGAADVNRPGEDWRKVVYQRGANGSNGNGGEQEFETFDAPAHEFREWKEKQKKGENCEQTPLEKRLRNAMYENERKALRDQDGCVRKFWNWCWGQERDHAHIVRKNADEVECQKGVCLLPDPNRPRKSDSWWSVDQKEVIVLNEADYARMKRLSEAADRAVGPRGEGADCHGASDRARRAQNALQHIERWRAKKAVELKECDSNLKVQYAISGAAVVVGAAATIATGGLALGYAPAVASTLGAAGTVGACVGMGAVGGGLCAGGIVGFQEAGKKWDQWRAAVGPAACKGAIEGGMAGGLLLLAAPLMGAPAYGGALLSPAEIAAMNAPGAITAATAGVGIRVAVNCGITCATRVAENAMHNFSAHCRGREHECVSWNEGLLDAVVFSAVATTGAAGAERALSKLGQAIAGRLNPSGQNAPSLARELAVIAGGKSPENVQNIQAWIQGLKFAGAAYCGVAGANALRECMGDVVDRGEFSVEGQAQAARKGLVSAMQSEMPFMLVNHLAPALTWLNKNRLANPAAVGKPAAVGNNKVL